MIWYFIPREMRKRIPDPLTIPFETGKFMAVLSYDDVIRKNDPEICRWSFGPPYVCFSHSLLAHYCNFISSSSVWWERMTKELVHCKNVGMSKIFSISYINLYNWQPNNGTIWLQGQYWTSPCTLYRMKLAFSVVLMPCTVVLRLRSFNWSSRCCCIDLLH